MQNTLTERDLLTHAEAAGFLPNTIYAWMPALTRYTETIIAAHEAAQPAGAEVLALMAKHKAQEAEITALDHSETQLIGERDAAVEYGTRLADAVSAHFRVPVGEYSNMNDPRHQALSILDGAYITDSDEGRSIVTLTSEIAARAAHADKQVKEIQALCKLCAGKDAEIATLRACLKTANSMAEEFEPKWYLRGNEIESKEAEIAALRQVINDAWASYERYGETSVLEGQPLIYASVLEEIQDAAMAQAVNS